jgi:hypothetical protein
VDISTLLFFCKTEICGIFIHLGGILVVEVSGMGFKDLPGAKLGKQGQSSSDKNASQQLSSASNTQSNQESLTSIKSSQH